MRSEIRIAGFGGQGVGLAGYILGRSVALYAELEAVMTQSYGPEARGGASSANVVISDRQIAYPFVQEPDILVAMSQEAYIRYLPATKPDSKILIDSGLVDHNEDDRHYLVPATFLAEEMGKRIVANMVMLGFLTALVEFVDREAMEKAIADSVKEKTVELNLKAFAAGYGYAVQESKSL